MDEGELRAFFRAVQPILQRTAPAAPQSPMPITPAVLDEIAWGVVLAYLANTDEPPPAIPGGARSGEVPLREEELHATLRALREPSVRPPLKAGRRSLARFAASARRLLGAYGWPPQRAAQAAGDIAAALAAVTPRP